MNKVPSLITTAVAAILATRLLPAPLPTAEVAVNTPEASPQAQVACDSSRTISVTGSATVNVVPDRALIQLGVQSNGLTPGDVEAVNTAAIQAVMQAVRGEGVAARDIATDLYLIYPLYDDYDSLVITGYRINNVVEITLRNVRQTSRVLAAALEAGANQVLGVEFFTSDLRRYRDQARQLAIQAAQEKAQDLAAAAGAQAGCILNISENSWSYYNGGWFGRNSSAWAQNVIQNAPGSGGSSNSTGDEPVSLGQISIRAEVAASFALE